MVDSKLPSARTLDFRCRSELWRNESRRHVGVGGTQGNLAVPPYQGR